MGKPIRGTSKAPKVEGPRYRVLEKSWIDGRMVGPGEQEQEITYLGVPGNALEPLNAAASAAVAAARKARAARIAGAEQANADELTELREALAAEREKFAKEKAAWLAKGE